MGRPRHELPWAPPGEQRDERDGWKSKQQSEVSEKKPAISGKGHLELSLC
jgi:hypothetical protein